MRVNNTISHSQIYTYNVGLDLASEICTCHLLLHSYICSGISLHYSIYRIIVEAIKNAVCSAV